MDRSLGVLALYLLAGLAIGIAVTSYFKLQPPDVSDFNPEARCGTKFMKCA